MPDYDIPRGIDWPDGFEQTPPDDRESTTKFSANFRRTKREVEKEMDRMEVAVWTLHDTTGSGGWPGVIVRWSKDGTDYAVACDHYTAKRDNLRAVYLWLHETRMRNQRPVETGEDEMAAARLPPGDDDAIAVAPNHTEEPHEVLGVQPDAPEEVVRAAARRLAANAHPDQDGGDQAEFKRIQAAKEAMLEK